jgi:hypothetical protein
VFLASERQGTCNDASDVGVVIQNMDIIKRFNTNYKVTHFVLSLYKIKNKKKKKKENIIMGRTMKCKKCTNKKFLSGKGTNWFRARSALPKQIIPKKFRPIKIDS